MIYKKALRALDQKPITLTEYEIPYEKEVWNDRVLCWKPCNCEVRICQSTLHLR